MLFSTIVHHYLLWHYTSAFGEILHLFKNFAWFITHFFSLPELVRTFFSPWKRMTEEKSGHFNLEEFAAYLIINFFSRLIGMGMRSVVLFIGLTALVLLCSLTITLYIFWIFAPAILIASIYFGFAFLLT